MDQLTQNRTEMNEKILMGMLHGGQVQTMMPKLHSTNFDGMELIRPMYFVREADICKWRELSIKQYQKTGRWEQSYASRKASLPSFLQ